MYMSMQSTCVARAFRDSRCMTVTVAWLQTHRDNLDVGLCCVCERHRFLGNPDD
jgi:hypothetical protein